MESKNLKPREKALSQGIDSLSDAELLAIVLRHGYKGVSNLELAEEILTNYGGLEGLMRLSISEIMDIKGVGIAKATEILASLEIVKRLYYQRIINTDALSSPEAVRNWVCSEIGLSEQECFLALFLDTKNKVNGHKVIFKGGVDNVQIDARELFREALKNKASKIIIAHNHPSQNVQPSREDIILTSKLVEAGRLMNIPVLDHIIVSYKQYYSFMEDGQI